MAYILIRHEVSATYKVLPKKKKLRKLRALLHFVFGRNRDTVGAAAPRLAEEAPGSENKPEAMQVLPDDVFALLVPRDLSERVPGGAASARGRKKLFNKFSDSTSPPTPARARPLPLNPART